MKDYIFVAGMKHELTSQEISVLKILLKADDLDLPIGCSIEREHELNFAFQDLKALFLHHLD